MNVDLFCPCCALLVILQNTFFASDFRASELGVSAPDTDIQCCSQQPTALRNTSGIYACTGLESREILAFVVRVALLQCLLDELEARRLRVTSGRVFRMLTGAIPQET